ncbi:PAAR domain-containing protein [Dyella terrae]|uniref:PAAR domain-containing protein n=1 Tax=Dyella terrae TaxID=522259 RepID=UPI001EFDD12F|nr:PAAR domain-containing protein [Dyella terrae]ULU23931.1 PAAR domain-containing protein [Dyella terrae]
MRAIVLVGHRHECPMHGTGTVASGDPEATSDGRAIARIGDTTSCGATITTGSTDFTLNGRGVARQGDRTSHDGILPEGDPDMMTD